MALCCVIGLGYIGLPTSIILSQSGHTVVGVDINEEIVESLNKGIIHIKEPNLDEALLSEINNGNFRATTNPVNADVYVIAVPTPFHQNDNNIPKPNIKYIENAVKNIIPYLKNGNLIILESTSPVGTTKK